MSGTALDASFYRAWSGVVDALDSIVNQGDINAGRDVIHLSMFPF
jgi:hypothetical protein